MSQMTIGFIPGCNDIPDSVLAGDALPVTDDVMVRICQNSKFSAVREEIIFMGFYKHGDTIGQPVSPVDGYTYSPKEMQFTWSVFTTRAPGPNFVSGQAGAPSFAAGQIALLQPANIYWPKFDIDDRTGSVFCQVSYFSQGKVPETITNDGIVKVYAVCQRQSLNATIQFISACPSAAPVYGVAFSYFLAASGGVPPYTFSVASGTSLPTGLSLNGSTGEISGTPSAHATFNPTFIVTDAAGNIDTLTCQMVVA